MTDCIEHDWQTWAEARLGSPRLCKTCGARNVPPLNPDDPFEYRIPGVGLNRGDSGCLN